MLSVPGKAVNYPFIGSILRERHVKVSINAFMVHRLDIATSGFTKLQRTSEVHKGFGKHSLLGEQ